MEYQSVIDFSTQELLSQDINILRESFFGEIKSLSKLNKKDQDERLDHIFKRLFRILPFWNEDIRCDLRLFVDLISVPGLKDISYVRNFLNSFNANSELMEKKRDFLIKIFEYYDSHSEEEIEKFNYVLKSGVFISYEILNSDLSDLSEYFDYLFSDEIMKRFDKETLSQIYRGFLNDYNIDIDKLLDDNSKGLFLASIMAKKMKMFTNHNYEFLDNVIRMFNYNYKARKRSFDLIYDYLVGDTSNEAFFEEYFLHSNCFLEMNELMEMINSKDYSFLEKLENFEDFQCYIYNKRDRYHYYVFRDGVIDKIIGGDFDIDHDFKDISNELDLENFKQAVLYMFFGISLDDANKLINSYGKNMKELEWDVIKKDRWIFSILKAIKNIVELELDQEKIYSLKLLYYNKIINNGLNYRGYFASSMVLECLFNRMYINTYNKRLLKLDDLSVLGFDDDVKLLDSGLNFDIMLTSLDGSYDYYNEEWNMKGKWNASFHCDSHGLCCSHIRNNSLGVISLKSVLLGFNHIPHYSLNNMGVCDIFSNTTTYNLKNDCEVKHFVPSIIVDDENRYGYNEFLIDRFLMDDKDNKLKLQPDYVVYYKFDDDYKNDLVYKKSLKVAKDFSIPIVVVDILKVKKNEKREIFLMEEELFSSSQCDKALMNDIVVRYMNNYTGFLIMNYSNKTNFDFSVLGMEDFFNRCIKKIENLSLEERKAWIDALEDIYLNEERKYKVAKKFSPYGCSVNMFIFKKFNLGDKIKNLKKGLSCDSLENRHKLIIVDVYYDDVMAKTDLNSFNNDTKDGNVPIDYDNSIIRISGSSNGFEVFLQHNDYTDNMKTIIDIVNLLRCGKKIEVTNDWNIRGISGIVIKVNESDDALIENLIISYLFESDRMLVDDMICHDFDCDISFKCNKDFDFVKLVIDSPVYKNIFDKDNINYINLDKEIVDNGVKIIESMDEELFLKIFSSIIRSYSSSFGNSFEDVMTTLLDKKKKIRSEFSKLHDCLNEKKVISDSIKKRIYD